MKKILHISKFYHPYFGGIEDVAYNIVTEMSSGYDQRVICFNHEKGTVRTRENGIEVIRINAPITISSQPLSFSYFWYLRSEIMAFQPDIIHVHLPNPLVATYLMRIPTGKAKIVLHWHSDIIGKSLLYNLYRSQERKLLERADTIIATSLQYVELSEPLQDFKQKIAILPNIVNEEKLQPMPGDEQEIAEMKKLYQGKRIVFSVGRHVAYKGLNMLIEAARYLPDNCVVLIGGTGELTEQLQHLAQPQGNKIQFIGRLSEKQMRCYLSIADVYAFPSIDRREAFGVALAEALYCGVPAVSFQINGSGSTWVNQDGQTGIVVSTFDAQKYAEAIRTLLDDEALRTQYAEGARKWVSAHFLKEQIQILTTIYG